MSDDDELRALIAGIGTTFGRDIDGWLAWFDVPFVTVAPEATLVLHDHDEARARFIPMFEALRAQGFDSTTPDDVRIRRIDERLALVDARFTRRRADGSVLEQLGALYTCRRVDGWRVASLLRHPYDADVL